MKTHLRLWECMKRLTAIYGDKHQAHGWMCSHHPALGAKPVDMIRGDRSDEVFAEIERIETGAYA